MRFRKLTDVEMDFVELNPNIIEIQYYPKYAKTHRNPVSIFRIKKGFAFLFSRRIISKFKKCEIVDIIEHTRFKTDIHYKTVKEAILGK